MFTGQNPHADREDSLAQFNPEHVAANDPRTIYVGTDAYVGVGRAVLGDPSVATRLHR